MTKNEMIEILKETIENNYDYDYNVGAMYSYETILEQLQNAGIVITAEESDQKDFRKLGDR